MIQNDEFMARDLAFMVKHDQPRRDGCHRGIIVHFMRRRITGAAAIGCAPNLLAQGRVLPPECLRKIHGFECEIMRLSWVLGARI